MFCGKCGTENTESAVYCYKCGAKIGAEQQISETISDIYTQSDISQKNRKIGIAAVAVAAVFVIILSGALFGGRSYKSTINKFFNAMYNADAKKIADLLPDGLLDYISDEEGIFVEEGFEALSEELKSQWETVNSGLGNNWKMSHRIISTEELSKRELSELQDIYKEIDVKVSDAKTVKVEVTAEVVGKEFSDFMEISVIKVGRSWYIDIYSMSGF